MTNLKTTLAGFLIGLPTLIDALIDAYQKGFFEGKTGIQTVIGLATVLLGVWAADRKKTL
jgi:hypothetical protein